MLIVISTVYTEFKYRIKRENLFTSPSNCDIVFIVVILATI